MAIRNLPDVRRTRKAQGLTQRELAAASGTSAPFIVGLEKGKETARLGLTLHVIRVLGLDLVARD